MNLAALLDFSLPATIRSESSIQSDQRECFRALARLWFKGLALVRHLTNKG